MPHDALYEERVSSCWTQALFWSLTAIFLVLLAWRMATAGPNTLSFFLLTASLLFLFYSLNFRTLVIRITSKALKLRFGIFACTLPLDNVQDCCHDDLPSLMRYGGAGIHFMFIHRRYRASFNFLEHPRVVIALRRPNIMRDVSFSTQRPDEVIRLLSAALPTPSAA